MPAKGETGLKPPGESSCAAGDLVVFLSSSFLPNLKKSRFLALSSGPGLRSLVDATEGCGVDSGISGACESRDVLVAFAMLIDPEGGRKQQILVFLSFSLSGLPQPQV